MQEGQLAKKLPNLCAQAGLSSWLNCSITFVYFMKIVCCKDVFLRCLSDLSANKKYTCKNVIYSTYISYKYNKYKALVLPLICCRMMLVYKSTIMALTGKKFIWRGCEGRTTQEYTTYDLPLMIELIGQYVVLLYVFIFYLKHNLFWNQVRCAA